VSAASIPAALTATLAAARRVTVLTGAGMSAESGVPTFRDAQAGLWSRYRPEELATREAFEADPDAVWSWYEWRRDLVEKAEPNPGHVALVELAALVDRLTIVTQNVDGLHLRAGSQDVIEFHGNLFENYCVERGHPMTSVPRPCPAPPPCPRCGSPARPGVVWFGESIPANALERALAAAQECDLFLAIGTSALVYPAAGLAETALGAGAVAVEVNPQRTSLSGLAEFCLRAPSGEALPAIVAALRARLGIGGATRP